MSLMWTVHPKGNSALKRPLEFWLASFILITFVIGIYWPVSQFKFVNLDDDLYVSANPYLKDGLTLHGIKWALAADLFSNSRYADYWQPMTFISRMIDISLFGLNPSGHHLMNLGFHLANTLLLFSLFQRMSKTVWPSALLALLFAIHPMRVEAVAWVTARKDLLSWFFGLLSIHYYVSVNDRKRMLSLIFFLLGLMSKPALVTLPFLLILLDVWPLKRFSSKIFSEKWIYFLVSALFYVVPFVGQPQAFRYSDPVGVLLNVLANYSYYFFKTIYPTSLAVQSPQAGTGFATAHIIGAACFLMLVTWISVRQMRTRPYFLVGWLWFLVSLFPMAGLIPVADRFMYGSMIGLIMILVWEINRAVQKFQSFKWFVALLFSAVVSILTILSIRQLPNWRNNETLFQHSVDASRNNFMAHNNLGIVMVEQGKLNQAEEHLSEAQKIHSDDITNANLGNILAKRGKIEEATKHFQESLRVNPNYAEAHNNLGNLLMQQGKLEEAVSHYLKAVQLKPDLLEGHLNLGFYFANRGDHEKAISHLSEVVHINPSHSQAHFYLGNLFMERGQIDMSLSHYREAIRLNPNDVLIQNGFGIALASNKQYQEAERHFQEAVRLKPDYASTHYNLGVLYSRQGNNQQAVQSFEEAIRIKPDYVEAQTALQMIKSSEARKQG